MNVFTIPEIADNYDAYYQTEVGEKVNKIEAQLIEEALQKVPAGKLLELGCGTGHWTSYFIKNGFEVVATDISDAMLKHAQQKGLNADIVKADSENLPFENASFNTVASITMMEFVLDQDKVFSEIYRVLKHKGCLLLGCLNANSQLAKNAVNDPVFKNANFFTSEKLHEKLKKFGTTEITKGVHFSSDFKVMDGMPEKAYHEPAFLLARVQKIV